MKKLVWILVLTLLLTGCGAASPAETTNLTEAPTQAAAYDDSLIAEVVLEQNYVCPVQPEPVDIDYHLPQLRDDSPDAQAFNREMLGFQDSIQAGKSVYYDTVRWESHWNGSLLSLVVTLRDIYAGQADYLICNYDFEAGKRLTDRELLDRLGWEDPTEALTRAAADAFDRDLGLWEDTPERYYADLLMDRSRTISETNLTETGVSYYAGEDQTLHAIATVASPAGGSSRRDLTLTKQFRPGKNKDVNFQNVKARLRDNRLTLSFSEGPGMFLIPGKLDLGKTYEVKGLYGSYVDLALGFCGNDGKVYAALLDDLGHVTLCDLNQGMILEGDFCAMGPLPGAEQVTGFQVTHYDDGWDFALNLADGDSRTVYELVWDLNQSAFLGMGDSLWQSEDLCQLGFHLEANAENDFRQVTWGKGGGMLAGGYCFYEGMTEEGMRYIVSLMGEDGVSSDLLVTRHWQLQWEGDGQRSTVTAELRSQGGSLGLLGPRELTQVLGN